MAEDRIEEREDSANEIEETSTEETEDNREEETSDEIRDNDYANDDEIEMDKKIEGRLDAIDAKLGSIFDTVSMFVDSGMVIREANPFDGSEITEGEDFAQDFKSIDDLDFSID